MEIFSAISAIDQHDYHHLTSDFGVLNYEPNHVSAIVHDMTFHSNEYSQSGDYRHFTALQFCEDRKTDVFDDQEWMIIGDGKNSGGSQRNAARFALPDQSAGKNRSVSWNSLKRCRSTIANDDQDSRNKRSVKSRKISQRLAPNGEEEDGDAPNTPLSAGKHSDASPEELGEATPSSSSRPRWKPKATNPQSAYARKRREKINERLRVLQSLVPNGTKVDISTMLEEAVQYVKFLQLQIKLLSSEDLWMYAPLAYNGMDIGVDLRLTAPRIL